MRARCRLATGELRNTKMHLGEQKIRNEPWAPSQRGRNLKAKSSLPQFRHCSRAVSRFRDQIVVPADLSDLIVGAKFDSEESAQLGDICSHKFFAYMLIVVGKDLQKTVVLFQAVRREDEREEELANVFNFNESHLKALFE
jgi:hypothetical protein